MKLDTESGAIRCYLDYTVRSDLDKFELYNLKLHRLVGRWRFTKGSNGLWRV